MPYRKVSLDESVNEKLIDGETAYHIHYGDNEVHALTLMENFENDPSYKEGGMECELCGETVDYLECETCGDKFATEAEINGHIAVHSKGDNE